MINYSSEELNADLCNMYNIPLIIDANNRVLVSVKDSKAYQQELGSKHTFDSSHSQSEGQPIDNSHMPDHDESPDNGHRQQQRRLDCPNAQECTTS